MKKYILAASAGASIGTIFSLINSFAYAGGDYIPVNPYSTLGAYYVAHFSPAMTMLIAVCLWAAIGLLFQLSSIIFDQDWSLLKINVVHFLVTSLGMLVCAIFGGWFPIYWLNILWFFMEFSLVYAIIYAVNYFQMKRSISRINQSLEK
ncbi:DUF3021 domain-containing protein [Streptococcus gallolyticus]|nr:DUF3021 domain-containing protein [Streptococcus gallolyticus]MBY5040727.1 DUF3021 domain-containing protein [Streptococcus gallolyticus]